MQGRSYAGLARRFLATVIDTFVGFMLSAVVLMAAGAAGALDLAAYQGKSFQEIMDMSMPAWAYVAPWVLLFLYYTAFELTRGATPGKMALGTRVTAPDGTRPGAWAIVLRNLIRIPEVIILLYVPSGISCLVSAKRQSLGDLAARTVVVRRTVVVAIAPEQAPPGASRSAAPAATDTSQLRITAADPMEEALDDLKSAALALRTAHRNYLRLSELEIERGGGVTAELSPEYAAAWHALADAVIDLQHASTAATEEAAAAGTTLPQASVQRADLLNLCRELEPYFGAETDEQVQEAYLSVARSEAVSRPSVTDLQ
jgi:uncharacterized RDD family membrane protein YckC